jgi:TRAP-type C4-dicarboxylate transport system substrate-binding protein
MGSARAEPVTLRLASVAAEGTLWAREIHSFAREIEAGTQGQVRVKWYLNGVAGDDPQELLRVQRGQLDGIGGATVCEMLAPSLLVLRVVGLFHTREEVAYVLGRLGPELEQEFVKSGFHSLANSVFGAEVLFSRTPVRSMADFRALRWWTWNAWNVEHIWSDTMPLLGVSESLAAPLEALAGLLGQHRIDGFMAVPTVALAYQWSALVPYVQELNTSMLPACMIVSTAALDALPIEYQQVIRAAGAKLRVRWNDTTATLDRALLDGLFEKQGVKNVPVSDALRSEFYTAAAAARAQLGAKLVPAPLLARVEKMLAEYRAGTAR